MKKIELYHGSISIIKKPTFGFDNIHNDYGQGFYCTEHKELAKEWASTQNNNGYSNHYRIDIDGLSILNLQDDKYSILNWLSLLVQNRVFPKNTPLMKLSSEWLLANYSLDLKDKDIIIGYRADDSYFSFARAFLRNEISLEQLSHAMYLGDLGNQIVLKSSKAFERIEFIDFEIADKDEYYKKRRERDDNARKMYFEELEQNTLEGLYIRDLMKKEGKNA